MNIVNDQGRTFIEEMQYRGLNPPDTIQIGKEYRFPGKDKSMKNQAASCTLKNPYTGLFNDFSSDIRGKWKGISNQKQDSAPVLNLF